LELLLLPELPLELLLPLPELPLWLVPPPPFKMGNGGSGKPPGAMRCSSFSSSRFRCFIFFDLLVGLGLG